MTATIRAPVPIVISVSPSVAGAQERPNHPTVRFRSASRYSMNFTIVNPKLIIDSERPHPGPERSLGGEKVA